MPQFVVESYTPVSFVQWHMEAMIALITKHHQQVTDPPAWKESHFISISSVKWTGECRKTDGVVSGVWVTDERLRAISPNSSKLLDNEGVDLGSSVSWLRTSYVDKVAYRLKKTKFFWKKTIIGNWRLWRLQEKRKTSRKTPESVCLGSKVYGSKYRSIPTLQCYLVNLFRSKWNIVSDYVGLDNVDICWERITDASKQIFT